MWYLNVHRKQRKTDFMCFCTVFLSLKMKHVAKFNKHQKRKLCWRFFFFWPNSPTRARATKCSRFLCHTHWHITVGRTPPDEESARRSDLYLTTFSTHNRHTTMPPAGLFLFSLCTLPVLLCPDCPGLLSLVYNTRNTNIHTPGEIRTRNPSKRAAVDPHLRPLGRWNWLLTVLVYIFVVH